MSWRERILRNRWQKAFSVLLAALIWFAVRSGDTLAPSLTSAPVDPEGDRRRFDNVPILVLTAAADLGRYKVEPDTVSVVVHGDPAALQQLSATNLEAYVNLSDGLDGPRFQRIHVYAPAGLVVAEVTPADLKVDRLRAGANSR